MPRLFFVICCFFAAVPLASARTWLDSTPPIVTVPADITAEATGSSGAVVTFDASATDVPDGPLPVNCNPASGGTFPIATTPVTCTSAPDTDGHTGDASFNVIVQDTTPPTFTSGPSGTTGSTSGTTADVSYVKPTASDLVDGTVPVGCTPPPGAFPIGTTHVACTASDSGAHSVTTGFDVVVTDTGNPTISVVPPGATEATGPGGAAVSYTVSASDNSGVSPTVECGTHPSGSTFPLGATSVTCTATDGSGNHASAPSFSVTVQDTHAPVLSLPANIETEASSTAGKAVTFSASALDTVAGSVPVNCAPGSGTSFPIGTTTVNCSATDGHNPAAQGSFTVTVTDHSGPTFTGVPPDRQVEANGSTGSVVNYGLPTATDVVDGPISGISCSPASGSRFAVGVTTVTCSATDSHGNPGSASFHISVGDTTPPALYLPAERSIVATSTAGISTSSSDVTAFLSAAIAVDIVDPHPLLMTHELGAILPVGTNIVTFEARDAAGNKTEKTAKLTVLPPGSAPVSIPPATKPPANVTGLKVVVGNGTARLSWGAITGAVKYIVYRSESGTRRTSAEGHGQIVYEGTARTFTDRGLKNGTEYRYVVVSQDAAGNQSGGVAIVAVPHRDLLRSPKDGASLKKAPKLIWAPDAEADYYNAQLIRNGVKILSVWPIQTSFTLHKTWKFQGRKYSLAPGVYKWYVWPGYGARSAVHYGEMLGTRTFRIVR